MKTHPFTTLLAASAFILCAHSFADTVETKDGMHLVGHIIKIDSGILYLHTESAGDIAIEQSQVTTFSTGAPVAVRLDSGTRIDGTIAPGPNGTLQIAAPEGTLTTSVHRVAASWPAGQEDPTVVAMRRHWSYEATVDINGETGNHEQLGTAGSLRATLKTPQDQLEFYSKYDRQVTDHVKSADQLKVGVDYAAHFAERTSWYARDEGGYDRVMDIRFEDIAAAGLGYDFIKDPNHILTGRAGLSYRYTQYDNPVTPTVNSVGADFELHHEWTFHDSRLVNDLAYVPAFNNFKDYVISHESYYEIPMADPRWKLRLGVSNDYNSEPGVGFHRLDTTYFTRFAMDWQ